MSSQHSRKRRRRFRPFVGKLLLEALEARLLLSGEVTTPTLFLSATPDGNTPVTTLDATHPDYYLVGRSLGTNHVQIDAWQGINYMGLLGSFQPDASGNGSVRLTTTSQDWYVDTSAVHLRACRDNARQVDLYLPVLGGTGHEPTLFLSATPDGSIPMPVFNPTMPTYWLVGQNLGHQAVHVTKDGPFCFDPDGFGTILPDADGNGTLQIDTASFFDWNMDMMVGQIDISANNDYAQLSHLSLPVTLDGLSAPPSDPASQGLTMQVVTPPYFHEGDTFTVNVDNDIANEDIIVQVVDNNNVVQKQFATAKTDSTGHVLFQLQMPNVLTAGYTTDVRTIRVTTPLGGGSSFSVIVNAAGLVIAPYAPPAPTPPIVSDPPAAPASPESQPASEPFVATISTDSLQERQSVTATVSHGNANSSISFQLVQDGNVIHAWSNLQTDGSGAGTYQLTVPDVLQNGNRLDAFTFRTIQGDHTTDQSVTVATWKPVVSVLTPPDCREGDVFSTSVMDATPGQTVTVKIIGDNNSVQYTFDSKNIDENGNATLALRMPYVLAPGYSVDGRNIRVTVGDYTQDFYVGLNEGLRVYLSTDNNIQEGYPLDRFSTVAPRFST